MPISKEKNLQIRNSTAEFLIFTRQAGEDGIEVRVADETVWLTQKPISVLFDKGRSTITSPGVRDEQKSAVFWRASRARGQIAISIAGAFSRGRAVKTAG